MEKGKTNMQKILIVINTLDGGGAEKILLETVKNLDKNKYKIKVVSIINRGIYIEEIKKYCDYNYIFPNLFKGKLNRIYYSLLLRLLKVLPAKLQNKLFVKGDYQTVIAYLEGAPTKLLAYTACNNKLAWVHVDPIEAPYSTKAYINLQEEIQCYQQYNKILCVSSELVKGVEQKFKIKENVSFQMNILDPKQVKLRATEYLVEENKKDVISMVTIGRLAPQKNYDLLLDVCEKLRSESITNFHINIIGQGLEEQALQEKIINLNLTDYVSLCGFMVNPYPYIKAAHFSVCSSKAEGFSTFVTESLILGKTVVTTDCAGMRDLLGESTYGVICENSLEGLYLGMKEILTNHIMREQYTLSAQKRSDFFDINKQVKSFERLLGDKSCY